MSSKSLFYFTILIISLSSLVLIVFSQDNQTDRYGMFQSLGPFNFSQFQLPWFESTLFCKTFNQTLLSVFTRAVDADLTEALMENGNGSIENATAILGNSWISATEVREGVWHWDSINEPLYYTRWFVGQPDDLTDLNCAYVATAGYLYWRDANCSAPMYFICIDPQTNLKYQQLENHL